MTFSVALAIGFLGSTNYRKLAACGDYAASFQLANPGQKLAGTFIDGGAAGSIGTQTFPYVGTLQRSNDNGTGPKGYLNYILFDRNFVYKNGGFMRLSTAAKETGTDVAHERLYFDNLVITEPGYIYRFVKYK